MHLNAEADGAQFAREDDDRIFPWGKTMRKYRIDELPQFINVFKREMHLVGPRPERKYWIDQFEKTI
jgi:lipopolysaccharide/colanic/teichoic acid biosynthesis glycosyltransferase